MYQVQVTTNNRVWYFTEVYKNQVDAKRAIKDNYDSYNSYKVMSLKAS